MIRFSNIHLAFDEVLIDQGDIQIEDGEVTLLVGSSGSGKTSLLHELGLLTNRLSGTYVFHQQTVNTLTMSKKRELLRNEIAFVFQDIHLFQKMTIAQNVQYAAKFAGTVIDPETIYEYMDYVDLGLDLNTKVTQMSGGERQRLAIICGMVKDAKMFIFDEPTAYLDNENKEKIIEIIYKLAHEKHKCVLIASHDVMLIERADTIYSIENKKIICTKQVSQNQKIPNTELKIGNIINNKELIGFAKNHIRNKKLYWLFSYVLAILLSGFALFFVFSNSYQQATGLTLLESMNHQIVIQKDNSKEYTQTDKIELQVSLKDYKIYPIVGLQGQCFYQNQYQEVNIVPYYSNTITHNKVYKEIDMKANIYCSYELYRILQQQDMYQLQVFDTLHPISFAGVVKPNVTSDKTIFIPYDQYVSLYKNAGLDIMDYPVKQMAVIIDDVVDIKEIQTILPQGYTIIGLEDYQFAIALTQLFNSSTVIYTWIIGFVALLIYQIYSMINQKKDFALLEVYGLSFKQLLFINTYKDSSLLLKVILFSICNVSIIMMFTKTFSYIVLYQALALIVINCLVIFLLEMFVFIVLLKRISPSRLLR